MHIRCQAFVMFLLAASSAAALLAAEGASQPPAAVWPALEKAAAADSGKRHEALLAVAQDAAAPPHVRALALLGAARTASTPDAAMAIWQRLAEDAAAPLGYRDEARRRIAETRRAAQGLPAGDGAGHRAELPELPPPAAVLHVAPRGDDADGGTEAAPLATLAGARDAIRKLRAGRGGALPAGGVRVVVHGGTYHAADTFALGAEDSGTAAAPIVYQAADGETPILAGGVCIDSWRPVSDAAIKERLAPAVRDRVREADLAALGVRDFGDATDLRRAPELFIDGTPQTLARWPDEGFVATGEILGTDTFKVWGSIQGCRDGKFKYLEDRPSTWVDEPDVRLYGYWFWDWYEEFQKVAAIDAGTRVLTLAKPYSQYGYRKGQRYRALNVLRELDRPGEWYLDRRSGKLYWLPPEGDAWTRAAATVSVWARPFVQWENVEHVVLAGLTIEDGRGDGIHVRGGAHCVIAGCTLRRLGGDALVVQGGRRHTVFGCTMHTLGCGGARVAGGDRKTLEAGGHVVENCTVADIARLKRTYAPAVHLDGCGNRIAHNRFERIPSSAMRVEGNDHVIELNAIRHVVQESDDQGGLDMFGNPLYRGVVIRWNRWSDITGGTHCGAAGVRLDDMISGVTVHGNVFERCGAVLFGGVQIHGGKENVVDNNLFVDCFAGLSFSRWGEKRWREQVARFLQDAAAAPYAARYPDLARLNDGPDVNWVTRNVFVRCGSVFLRDGGIQRSALNAAIDGPFDAPVLADAQAMARDRRLAAILAAPIPLDEIGPYDHPWRAAAP
ncbi:MAG TPA: right-handed parallel beta-helix repeat-containing protein [Candidatus Anammoximicrobium sp.]|mgnify:CR=1 FL=1|nr:right-handed parallel beta-helix repeat-containing protein [Candidatus Anammoximicrobium sp.]